MQVANVRSYKQGLKMYFNFGANLASFCIHSHIYIFKPAEKFCGVANFYNQSLDTIGITGIKVLRW